MEAEDFDPDECKGTLYLTFNCSTGCLGTQIPSRIMYPSKPLILVITAFLIRRNGEIIRPVREFTRNFLFSVQELGNQLESGDSPVAGPSADPDTSANYAHLADFLAYEPSSPYRDASPEPRPSTSLSSGTQTRRASKRKKKTGSVRFKSHD